MNETFWTLLRNAAHWEFEIFLMLLFDGIIVGLCWPFARKHWQHHIARDRAEVTGAMQTPTSHDCADCGGEAVLLDTSVVICKAGGHVTVPKR